MFDDISGASAIKCCYAARGVLPQSTVGGLSSSFSHKSTCSQFGVNQN